MKILIVLAVLCLGCVRTEEKKESVTLTLFYESYCPYSISFVVDQLYPTWKYFKSHLQVDLVPYGNAKQTYVNGSWVFTCQHGPKECVGNELHACAVHEACGQRGTLHCAQRKLKRALSYVDCVMKQTDQQAASDKCATSNELKPAVINSCASGKLGNSLVDAYGNQTAAFRPPVTYVPFIVLNGKHNDAEQTAAEADLKDYLCKKYLKDYCEHH